MSQRVREIAKQFLIQLQPKDDLNGVRSRQFWMRYFFVPVLEALDLKARCEPDRWSPGILIKFEEPGCPESLKIAAEDMWDLELARIVTQLERIVSQKLSGGRKHNV